MHRGRVTLLRRTAGACLSLGLVASVLAGPVQVRAAEPEAERAARHLAEELGRAPNDLQIVHEPTSPSTTAAEDGFWAGKLVDETTGTVHSVYVMPDGKVGGPELLAERAAAAAAAMAPLARKADSALQAAVADVADRQLPGADDADRQLPVAIWVEADTAAAEQAVRDRHPELTWVGERPMATTMDSARAIRAELWEARRAIYDEARAGVEARIGELGGTVAYASTSAPLLFADLPAGAMTELAERADVLSLGLEQGSESTMATAGAAVGANWTSGSGDQGNGSRVAVVEYHNVHTTGDLAGQVVKSYSTSGRLAYASGGANHPTWVAGAVASLNGTWRGVAPGADIVSAGTGGYSPSVTTDRAIIAAADWAVSPSGGDADIVNTSIAQDTAVGSEEGRRYFDSIGWEDNRVVVGSSGNYGTFGHWDVLSPGTGWNVLTVGGIDDRGTSSTSDDRLWYYPGSNGASYRDPSGTAWNRHGDFNKPNVSAPSVNVRTANGMIGSGTSVAAPIVAGVAAQLVARDATLLSWPEAVRALIMAGATRRTPMPNGSVNTDHEGVGTVSARLSNRMLSSNNEWGDYVVGTMSRGQTVTREIAVTTGQRVRVVLAWSSHTSGSSNLSKANALTADLDLRVTEPGGRVVGSYSFDNNYEVVDIVASRSGTMTARVTHDRFDASSEPYAIAWLISDPFTDIEGSMFRADILWALREGITTGCGGTRFCPDAPVTREQMASFLVRALGLPATGRDFYTDDGRSIHHGDINRLAASGITTGCSAGRFCPTHAVTRAEMASFLARAFDYGATGRDYFTDDNASIHEDNINRVAAAGVTSGCGGTRYCPNAAVTRGQMVAFLHRALGS